MSVRITKRALVLSRLHNLFEKNNDNVNELRPDKPFTMD